MNKHIFTALAVSFSLSILIWSGCKKDDSPKIENFIIQIDSIVHADTIDLGEDLAIKFYGPIGPDGCYAFEGFENSQIGNGLATTCWGKHTFESTCAPQAVYMNGNELTVHDIPVGDFTVKAIQPDGSAITHTVFVKE